MRSYILSAIYLFAALSAYGYEMLKGSIPNSAIYPGAVHTFSVSVPEGYDASQEVCLYVGLDGALYHAPEVIDSLIAVEKMPLTIGVYFQPGVIKDRDGNVVRYNRSNEYDAVDGRLAAFIETELLPAAKAMSTSAGLPIRITDDPDGRAISGASSGGIGAFVVAWQRPDLFRRIYTTCGTYVAMRGGDQLPAIVRKTEPLPLRIYIHDGSKDAWNPLFGHWYEQNRLLASALQFSGYDMKTFWDDSGHSIAPGTRLFPEAMTWLWRDYPRPLVSGKTANNMLTSLLSDDSGWHKCDNPDFEAAPLHAVYPDSTYCVNVLEGSQWIEAATVGEPHTKQKAYLLHDLTFTDPGVCGMAFDTDGNLFVATTSGVQVCDQNGRVRAILRYPSGGVPVAFAFIDNKLLIKMDDGSTWERCISAKAAPKMKITVKSQGAS